jgi:hypothetical protein
MYLLNGGSIVQNDDFVNHTAYTIFPVQLPKLSARERDAAIRNRIAGWYPGYCDETVIITLKNGGQPGAYLIVVLREPMPESPLCLPTLAAMRFCKDGTVIVAGELFAEYVQMNNGVLISQALCVKKDGFCDLFETGLPIEVYCRKEDRDLIPEDGSFHFHDLDEALAGISAESVACFPGRLPRVLQRRLALFSIALVLTLLCGIELFRFAGRENERRRAEHFAQEQRASREQEQEAEQKYLAELEAEFTVLAEERSASIYEILEILAASLTPDIRVASASLKSGSFLLDAWSHDALACVSALERHPRVSECNLRTIIRENGQEHFTVQGSVSPLSLSPAVYSTAKETIVFYETSLAAAKEANSSAGFSAAAAGEKVRRLLEESGCTIRSFRYLDAEGGRIIDCSFESSSYALVRALQKTNEASFPLNVQSLETRSRYPRNGIEAGIQFFAAAGPEKKDTDSGTTAGIVQIASLYYNGRAEIVPQLQRPPQSPLFSGGLVAVAETDRPAVPVSAQGEYLGFIELNGVRYTYIKDRTGEVRRADENYSRNTYCCIAPSSVLYRR